MYFNRWDSFYYSRPISYRSYYPRQQKLELLKQNDSQTQEVLTLLRSQEGGNLQDLGGLGRGIRFNDLEVGRRNF